METDSPATTGSVPADQHQYAQSLRFAAQARRPLKKATRAIAANARRRNLSLKIAGIEVS
jgi:hypothetical protein